MEPFKLKILTPTGVILEEDDVTSVSLISSNGEIGILPGHVSYSGLLGTGALKYITSSNKKNQVLLEQGFCKFQANELTILADRAQAG